MKDHIAQVVNELRDTAVKFHATHQLRERLRSCIEPLITAALPDVPYSGLEQRFFQGLNTITRRAALQVLGGHSDAFMEQVRNRGDERRLFKHLFKAAALVQAQEPVGAGSVDMDGLPEPSAYRYPCAGINNGFNYLESIQGEEERFISLWEPMFTKAQIQSLLWDKQRDGETIGLLEMQVRMLQSTPVQPMAVPDGSREAFEKCLYSFGQRVAQDVYKDIHGTTMDVSADKTRYIVKGIMADIVGKGLIEALIAAAPAAQGDAKVSSTYAKHGYILQAADGHQTWLKGDPADGMGRYGKVIQLYKKETPCTP